MLWYLLFCYILSNFIGSSNAVRQNNILTRGLFSRYDGFNPPGPVNGSWAMHWFWQSRDHFHEPNDEPNWRQRYWESFTYYEEGGPIFIRIDGEWESGPGRLTSGAWLDWARKEKAALFVLEHRYYGKSRPTDKITTEELQWLSSRQALFDVAKFVESMTETHGYTGPWIAFGGSYGGSLAAWAREKFPHLIKGAVSSSGPLLAKVNFYEYLEVVHEAMGWNGPECNLAFTSAIEELEVMITEDVLGVEELFYLCYPLDVSIEEDISRFMSSLVGILMGAVQREPNGFYNRNLICAIMENEYLGTPLQRLAMLSLYGNGAEYCWDHTYQSVLDHLRDEDYYDDMDRQWAYQKCTEFGWYKSSDQPGHPYGTKFPIETSVKICSDIFGELFTPEYVEYLVQETNTYYGATNLDVDNVVFVHGSLDPWHAMGRLTDLNENSPAFVINGTSHCIDINENEPDDSDELVHVREMIGDLVSKWVQEAKTIHSNNLQ